MLFIHAALVPLGFNNIAGIRLLAFSGAQKWLDVFVNSSDDPEALLLRLMST